MYNCEMTDYERCTPPEDRLGRRFYCEECDKELRDGDVAYEYDDMIFCSEDCIHDYVIASLDYEDFIV